MAVNIEGWQKVKRVLQETNTRLVAVSKIKPVSDILSLYDLGQRDFGENYVQELVEKQRQLPADVQWHFIGHLQRNKVKDIISFVYLIHGVDSLKLLLEINKQAAKVNRKVKVLLQVHIATEDTKYGMDENEVDEVLSASGNLTNIEVTGLMGMASFSDDETQVKAEFGQLKGIYDRYNLKYNNQLTILSMGMSGDYELAISCGSNMVRIGSLLFGNRHS